MRVPMIDLTRRDPDELAELREAFERVLASGRFILGPEVEAFEAECAAYLGAKHAIGVSSGTDALLVSLMALGIGPGDEVLCPAYSFVATAEVVVRVGAKPVFADIDEATMNLDPEDAARRVTKRTRALLPVHLFGLCADMARLEALAREHGLFVVEDAAQAFGAEHRGRKAGTMGTFGCFSFFPTKNLGGFGDGGLVVTADDELAARVRSLRQHGARERGRFERIGGNFRLDALQAALLRVELPRVDARIAARRANAARYRERLRDAERAGRIVLPSADPTHTYNQLVVRCEARDALRARLRERGVASEVYYDATLPEQACFGAGEGPSLPVAHAASRTSLALPVAPELGVEEVELAADAIAQLCRVERG